MAKIKLICLCTPSLGNVSIWWARQIAEVAKPPNIGIKYVFTRDAAGNEIAESRNWLVEKCLALEGRHGIELDSIFWVDDDVLVTRGALLQLYSHHKPVVAGVYFFKGEPSLPLIFPERLQGTAKFVPDTVIDAWGVHSGLTLVKADVYKRLMPRVGKDKYGRCEWYRTERTPKVDNGMLDCGGTEDLFFCNLLPEIGVRPIVDCSKHSFGFHYDATAEQGYPVKQYDQWSKSKPITWETDGGTVTWE